MKNRYTIWSINPAMTQPQFTTQRTEMQINFCLVWVLDSKWEHLIPAKRGQERFRLPQGMKRLHIYTAKFKTC